MRPGSRNRKQILYERAEDMSITELLQKYQMNIMLVLSAICGLLAFFIAITKTLAPFRKKVLLAFELCSMFLLTSDRFAYFYHGNTTRTGFWMVRISNYMAFLLFLGVMLTYNLFLIDLYRCEGGLPKTPLRLNIACVLCAAGAVLLTVAQFTGLYYTIDENNCYHRSDGFVICYLFPLIILILDLSVIIEHFRRISKLLRTSMLLFSTVPLLASIVQIFTYGLSLTNISVVGMAVVTYVLSLLDMNETVARANRREIEVVREEQQHLRLMFEQTAASLANAIDAKDTYTHGHSRRVAEYAVKIAEAAGKSEKECEEIYFAGLLHDVGKIGIANSIINKKGKLTEEEYAVIKTHPVIGKQILSGISQSPYLSIGAHYHHERYDGRGYPEGRKGEDIPDIARIIAVADAYDAMTSRRSYRATIPQQYVREEFIKGMGTQFDPVYAGIMIQLIDQDSGYFMKEREDIKEESGSSPLVCGGYRSAVSPGILLTSEITHIRLCYRPDQPGNDSFVPSFLLFDSLDGKYHSDEQGRSDQKFFEYAAVRADGRAELSGARNSRTEETAGPGAQGNAPSEKIALEAEAVRYKDHVLLRLKGPGITRDVIIALPDSSRYCYLALTGEHCTIDGIEVAKSGEKIDGGYIPRIAEEVSFINVPAGGIPNVQSDNRRADTSVGVEVTDGMRIRFHAMSLPTARLIWHCPFAVLYSSADGKVNGRDYRELSVIRFDGENWNDGDGAENQVYVTKPESFTDWNKWKDMSKAGQDCELLYQLKDGVVTVTTEYCGLQIRFVTACTERFPKIYTALTGDQCAITNIRIIR